MSVVIETTIGDFTVDLYTDHRPQTCKNFLKLCKLKYYNFSLFHTVQANFIAQTGDPTGTGSGGESVFGIVYGPEQKYYEGETMPKIKHSKLGLLSMVNCGNNMLGSQFFVTLGNDLPSLDEHCVFAEVTEGHDVLLKLNESVCDLQHRPYKDIRITHTVILDDPFEDMPGMQVPTASPDISMLPASNGRIGADEEVGEELTGAELEEAKAEQEARAGATILEIVGDLPHADIAPPENVLFVCKLNPVTKDEDLETLFSRFGNINSCEVIRDHLTGESLQYAFIEFAEKTSCEEAFNKMDNVLIDDCRIRVDFSQSVSKIRWKGKGRGVELVEKVEEPPAGKLMTDLRYSSVSMMSRGREQYYRERRGRDDEPRRRRDDDTRRRREDEPRRRDDRRREEDRRRRTQHDSSRRPLSDSSRRQHRDYVDGRHGRGGIEETNMDSRHHRRHEEQATLESSSHRSRYEDRNRSESLNEYKQSKHSSDRSLNRNTQDNGESSIKQDAIKSSSTASPLKRKASPQRKVVEEKLVKTLEEEENKHDISKNEGLSQSLNNSDVGSAKLSDSKKKKVPKKKSRKKRRSSSTSSDSSDTSVSSSTSSSSSSSSSTSSSSSERIISKKNGKSKKHRRSGVMTKKYYDHKGKLIKVVKKHRKNDTSSSDSSSESDRKNSKRKHKRKKKKKKLVKRSGKKTSEDCGDSDSEESGMEEEDSKGSKNTDKTTKKRKHVSDKSKSKKDVDSKMSENSLHEDEETELVSPEKKKLKSVPVSLKKVS